MWKRRNASASLAIAVVVSRQMRVYPDRHCGAGSYCNTGVAGVGTNACKAKLDLTRACT